MLYNLIGNFFTLVSVFAGGSILGIIIIANIFPDIMKNYKKKDKLLKNKELKNYQLLYYDELEELKDDSYEKQDLLKLNLQDLIEETPVGKVVMKYNIDYESYWYYSNNKNIPYKVLDTIARKYAITNNCKSICVNYKKEYNNSKNELQNKNNIQKENEINLEIKKDDSPFIKLKPYNIKSNNTKSNNKNNKNNNNLIVVNNSNKFTYKGKLSDYYYKPPEDTNHVISYKDFKLK
tara:strand:+ start:2360 stop:3064 length:705 start_codon:yes stop_codon:yes gene_type:complete